MINCVVLLKKGKLFKPDETPSILRLFFIVLLFSIGWSFGFAGTLIVDELLQVIFRSLFLVFGGLLGVYILVIYGFLSTIVRSTWASWLTCRKEERQYDFDISETSTEPPAKNGSTKKPVLQFKEMHYGPEADFRSPEPLDGYLPSSDNEKETDFTETQEKSIDLGSVSSQSSHGSVGYPVPKSPTENFALGYLDSKVNGMDQLHESLNYDSLSIDLPDSDEETAL